MIQRIFPLLIISSFLLLLSCSKDDEAENVTPVESQLILSPNELLINDDQTGTLSLSVQPANTFQWNVASKPDWIQVSPSSGTINNQILQLQVTPLTTDLSPGNFNGTLEIITNGAGKATSSIRLSVAPHPIATVSSQEISFAETESEKTITVTNSGTGNLTWALQDLPEWLTLNSYAESLGEGESFEILATVDRTGLPVGLISGQGKLVSNSEEGDITLEFSMDVPANAVISSSELDLEFGYFEDSKSFYVINDGNIPVPWNIDTGTNSYITTTPDTGNLAVGDSVLVALNIERTNLNTQTYETDILINYADSKNISLPVRIDHYKEEKWLVDGNIIDAEYDRINDVIIAISDSPDEIKKFDPETGTVSTLGLNLPPNCLSIGQDGNYAAVGHNGTISYVDLSSMQLLSNYAVTVDVFDIVLANNGWVYAFPWEDQWERIRCIDLSNGAETNHTGNLIYEQTKAKLHPSGDFIYGATTRQSPSDFEKYDILGGTAAYLYDSPYHGAFDFAGDIWISDDGTRLFAKSGNVFNSSATFANDMTYNGELAGEGNVVSLDHSSASSRVYAIFTTDDYYNAKPSNEVRIYETDFLAFQGTTTLPGFLVPDGSGGGTLYDSEGYFGFFSASGAKFYAIVKAQEGSGLQNEWAIVTLDVQ